MLTENEMNKAINFMKKLSISVSSNNEYFRMAVKALEGMKDAHKINFKNTGTYSWRHKE